MAFLHSSNWGQKEHLIDTLSLKNNIFNAKFTMTASVYVVPYNLITTFYGSAMAAKTLQVSCNF